MQERENLNMYDIVSRGGTVHFWQWDKYKNHCVPHIQLSD